MTESRVVKITRDNSPDGRRLTGRPKKTIFRKSLKPRKNPKNKQA